MRPDVQVWVAIEHASKQKMGNCKTFIYRETVNDIKLPLVEECVWLLIRTAWPRVNDHWYAKPFMF